MHIIRLHGPWEYEPLAGNSSGEEAAGHDSLPRGRTTFPVDWNTMLGVGFRGGVRLSRRFHRPTGLQPGQRVFLVIEAEDGVAAAALNRGPLGAGAPTGDLVRWEIAERLEKANLLTLDMTLPGGQIRSVRLEIEE